MSSRILLLSAHEPVLRPDTDLGDVVRDLLAALARMPGCEVVHHEVRRIADVERAVRVFRPDAVFNACETFYGESKNEPAVPLVLERLGVSFTGSPAQTLRQCLAKGEATALLRAAGVPVPSTVRVDAPCAKVELPAGMTYPVIVKPEREDGSVGIGVDSVVHDDAGLLRAVRAITEGMLQPALVQTYVPGREIAIALLGHPEPRVLPPGEIAFDEETFEGRPKVLTYASKWDEDSPEYGATRSVGAAASPPLLSRLAAVARRAFEAVGMRDYGRVDVRLDASGKPLVIDVNPNCDVSTGGGFAKAAARAGLSYADAVAVIASGALARAPARVGGTPTPPEMSPVGDRAARRAARARA